MMKKEGGTFQGVRPLPFYDLTPLGFLCITRWRLLVSIAFLAAQQ